jgi:hypothetical protein
MRKLKVFVCCAAFCVVTLLAWAVTTSAVTAAINY